MRKYPSEVSREVFEIVRPLLEGVRKTTKPRKVNLYNVFCGLLYILKSGGQWRMLPSDFPPYTTVRYYYDIWSEEQEDGTTILEQVLKNL